MCKPPPWIKTQNCPVNTPQSIAEKLSGIMCPVLSGRALPSREDVCTEQPVEINQDHNIHQHHGGEKVCTMIQPGVIVDNVPGEVELCAQTKYDIGQEVDKLVDVVHGRRLSTSQLQHQPQVQSDTVDFYKQSYYSTGYIQLSIEGVQETTNHLRRKETQTGGAFLTSKQYPGWTSFILIVFLVCVCSFLQGTL